MLPRPGAPGVRACAGRGLVAASPAHSRHSRPFTVVVECAHARRRPRSRLRTARRGTVDQRGADPGRHDRAGRRERGTGRAAGSGVGGPVARLPVPGRRSRLCGGVRLQRLGPAVRRAPTRSPPPVPGAAGAAAPRAGDPWRRAAAHPGRADGRLLRVGGPVARQARRGPADRGRDARLPLPRPPGPARLRGRYGEPGRRRRPRGGARRRGRRPGLRGRQLRRRTEVPARPDVLERALRRGAGTGHRPHQTRRHRVPRRGQGRGLPPGAQHHHRPGRHRTRHPAGEHALRELRERRVRYVLHRVRRRSRRDGADAPQHVPRRSARDARPHPRLLHRGHRLALLRPPRRLPRRPAAPARSGDRPQPVSAPVRQEPAPASDQQEPAAASVRQEPVPAGPDHGSLRIGSLQESAQ